MVFTLRVQTRNYEAAFMRFKNRTEETSQMVGNLCLLLSLGALFIQIWTLMSAVESYLRGEYRHLGPALILSLLALACCALSAWTTTFDFSQNNKDGQRSAENTHAD